VKKSETEWTRDTNHLPGAGAAITAAAPKPSVRKVVKSMLAELDSFPLVLRG